MGFYAFLKGIRLKVNTLQWLEFELTSWLQHCYLAFKPQGYPYEL